MWYNVITQSVYTRGGDYMYRVRQIQIRKGQKLYDYCMDITRKVSKLYNRANYIVRQYATGTEAEEEGRTLHPNQKEILQMVRQVICGTKFEPKGKWLGYYQLDFILKKTKDFDYYNVPSQVNQQTLKLLVRDYRSFFEGLKRYHKNPGAFTGRPQLPGYKRGGSTVILTNQVCVLHEGRFLKLPKCRDGQADLGPVCGMLKEARVKPMHDRMVLEAVLETGEEKEEISGEKLLEMCREITFPGKVLGIDPGVNNLLAVTNNFGEQPLLISGRIIKSINRYYNKELARLKSAAVRCNGRKITKRIRALTRKRNNRIKDAMHKISRWVKEYALSHNVKIVAMGHNRFQKQEASMGHKANQNFVQIPMEMLRKQLKYKLEEAGILFVSAEESYTSKSDYLAQDDIPVYGGQGYMCYPFSGKRVHRGLYRHYNGTVSNADINGAANILRKVFPNVPKELWNSGLLDSPYQVRIF